MTIILSSREHVVYHRPEISSLVFHGGVWEITKYEVGSGGWVVCSLWCLVFLLLVCCVEILIIHGIYRRELSNSMHGIGSVLLLRQIIVCGFSKAISCTMTRFIDVMYIILSLNLCTWKSIDSLDILAAVDIVGCRRSKSLWQDIIASYDINE